MLPVFTSALNALAQSGRDFERNARDLSKIGHQPEQYQQDTQSSENSAQNLDQQNISTESRAEAVRASQANPNSESALDAVAGGGNEADPVSAATGIIANQAAIESNVQVIRSADKTVGTIINLVV